MRLARSGVLALNTRARIRRPLAALTVLRERTLGAQAFAEEAREQEGATARVTVCWRGRRCDDFVLQERQLKHALTTA